MEAIDFIDTLDYLDQLLPKTCRDRSNPFEEYSQSEFKSRYCLSKETVLYLVHLTSSNLAFASKQNNFVPPLLQVTVALRFYATSHFQSKRR